MKNIPVRSIKSPHVKQDAAGSFRIRTVQDVLGGQEMVHDLHRHDFHFILALRKARGSHEIDFVPYPVSDNSIFFIRPGQVHRLSLLAGSDGYLMEFSKGFFHSHDEKLLLRKAANKCFCQLDADHSTKLQTILSSIHEEYNDRKEGFYEVIKANLSIFFIEIVRQRQNKGPDFDNRNDYAQERLQDFLDLLETEVSAHKQVSYYAGKLNLSQFQLNSICKKMMGKSASDLIYDHILLESKRHLLSTSDQVNQIAYRLGYEDVSYYIRFFKKHTGYTPEIFRKNLR